MYRTVVIGGGWAGCSAAISAKKAGSEVIIIEKTDMLMGLGNVGGIMRNNGRFTAAEENIALGASEVFELTDSLSRHVNIDFPGHKHASLYDVTKIEAHMRRMLLDMGIEIRLMSRAVDVVMSGKSIEKIVLADGAEVEGDVFMEGTGSTGPMGNCLEYGNGCSMCILRCPAFGPRVSISQRAGVPDIMGRRKDGGFGAFSGSSKLDKNTLSDEIRESLDREGVAIVPLPAECINRGKLDMKVCQQYALNEFAENIVLLDTGHAKLMTPFFPLEQLRKVKGFENAKYVDPYAGGKGNSIRYLSVTERNDSMKVKDIDNLLCAGEKSGLFVGHTEAITTGSLAGHNCARYLKGLKPLELPVNLVTGDLISYANEKIKTEEGMKTRYTFAGAEFFDRMKERDLYTVDKKKIRRRVERMDLYGIYDQKII
ncbi:MAG: FAD-dependent oxidoreductase [Clostridiales bacterium]|nr:FAD-dependent oxidoreductase [Clostridiales bacterium]